MSKSRATVDDCSVNEDLHEHPLPALGRPNPKPRCVIRFWLSVAPGRTPAREAHFPDLYEASILELQEGLDAGHFSSVDLVRAYIARIEEVNLKGPALRAVLEINPSALAQAAALDKERRKTGKRSLMHGIPILLKDIIGTVASEGMNTSAGSYSLLGSIVPDDAGVVKRLRKAGAIILGKTNLSEFSHMRGDVALGWSAIGGQSTSAYYPNADACGSSSGSAVAVSIGLATVALGTETDGSITCPAGFNNVAGIKPTVGLTSRAGVIPITQHQDTIGPLTRSLTDSAILLTLIAGKDPNDNYTLAQPPTVPNYTLALNTNALRGKRIGVPRYAFLNESVNGNDGYVNRAFEEALEVIRSLGADVVDPADLETVDEMMVSRGEEVVANTDFKIQINEYFESLLENPSGVRSLADLIAFNDAHPELEKPPGYESQSAAQTMQGRDATFYEWLAYNVELGATRGIDATLKKHNLDALVLPVAGLFMSGPAAIAGYPIITVPMSFYPDTVRTKPTGPITVYPAPGVPIGLSFFGTAYSEFELIGFGYAYEQKTRARARLGRRAFDAAVPRTQLVDVVEFKKEFRGVNGYGWSLKDWWMRWGLW